MNKSMNAILLTTVLACLAPFTTSHIQASFTSRLSEAAPVVDDSLKDVYQPEIHLLVDEKELSESSTFYEAIEVCIQVEDVNMLHEASYILVNDEKQQVIWNLEDVCWSSSVKLSKSGDYQFSYHIENKDGSIGDKVDQNIVHLDVDAPNVLIKMNQDKIDDSFSTFYKGKQTLFVEVEDVNLDLHRSELWLNDKEVMFTYDEIKKAYHASIDISDGLYKVSYLFVDNGNHKIEKTCNPFIVDTIAPKVRVKSNYSKAFENKDIVFEIEIEDKNITEEDIQFSYNVKDKEQTQKLLWTEKDGHLYATFMATDEGAYRIHLDVRDKAGNIGIYNVQDKDLKEWKDISFTIDKQAPIISTQHENATYISKHQVITVTLSDEHMALDDVILHWQKDGLDISLTPSKVSDTTLKYEIIKDGLYQISLKGCDLAGNQLLYKQDGQFVESMKNNFVVDSQKPMISIQKKTARAITSQDVDVKVHIQDKHLSIYQIFMKRNGKDIVRPSLKGIRNLDTTYSFHEDKQQEGTYELYAVAYDLAGNSYKSEPISFIIDRLGYDVKAFVNQMPLKDHLTYISNQAITIDMNWKDANPEKEIIEVKKNGVLQEVKVTNNQFHLHALGEKNKVNKYELSMKFIDQAGNAIERKSTFILDQQIPIPVISNDIFKNRPVSSSWTPRLNGENKQFRVIECQLLRNQKVIDYAWGNPIVEDGAYALDVLVQDEAFNHARFLSPIYFEIDKTPTRFLLINTTTKKELNTSTTNQRYINLQMVSSGSSKDELLQLRVNHKEVEIDKTIENVSLELREGTNEIYAKAKDQAGNISEKTWNIKFVEDKETKSQQKDTFSNYYIVGVITLLVIVSGSIFYVTKRR